MSTWEPTTPPPRRKGGTGLPSSIRGQISGAGAPDLPFAPSGNGDDQAAPPSPATNGNGTLVPPPAAAPAPAWRPPPRPAQDWRGIPTSGDGAHRSGANGKGTAPGPGATPSADLFARADHWTTLGGGAPHARERPPEPTARPGISAAPGVTRPYEAVATERPATPAPRGAGSDRPPPARPAAPGTARPGDPSAEDTARSVGRGGVVNLVAAFVYGASNFALLAVVNRELGTRAAGAFILAIALFNIAEKIAELGCATAFVRWMAHHRALRDEGQLRATLIIGLVPVTIVSTVFAIALFAYAPTMAGWLPQGHGVALAGDVLRAMAPLLPITTIYNVIVQGTRGFDTMKYQAGIEKIGRAIALPVLALVGAKAGLGAVGIGILWAGTNLVAFFIAARAMWGLIHRTVARAEARHEKITLAYTRDFWSYTLPRAIGQAFEVGVAWLDTILVGAIKGARPADIYASGTRYILPGQFAGEALMQVSGPRVSGFIAAERHDEAGTMLRTISAWQVVVMWPIYLITLVFAVPLLSVLGPHIDQAQGALMALSVAMLIAAPFGPVSSVILMSGRSRQAMFNTAVLVALNVGGNLLFVPKYGITAAGFVWGVTILVAAALPGWQSYRSLGIVTVGRAGLLGVAVAATVVGVPAVLFRAVLGNNWSGLGATVLLGGGGYLGALVLLRDRLELTSLVGGLLGRRGGSAKATAAQADTARDRPAAAAPRPSSSPHHPTLRPSSETRYTAGYRRPRTARHAMNEMEPGFQLSDVTGLIKRRIGILAAAAAVGLVVAAGLVVTSSPTYTSTAKVTITAFTSDPFAPNFRPQDHINLPAEKSLIKSEAVASAVRQQLDLDPSPTALARRAVVTTVDDSLVIQIDFTASTPARAQKGAQGFAEAYLAQRKADQDDSIRSRLASVNTRLDALTKQYAQQQSRLNNAKPGDGEGSKAQAQIQTLNTQISALTSQKTDLQGIDTYPGRVSTPANLPPSGLSPSRLATPLGAAAFVGLLGVAFAWFVDRRDPAVSGPGRVAKLSPTTAMRFLPTVSRRQPDPAELDAAIDRLAVELVGTGGTAGRPSTALLVGTGDRGPAALAEEVAASLTYAGVPSLFVVAGETDLEVRHAVNVPTLAGLVPAAGGAAPTPLAGGPVVTWIRATESAESSGLLRRSVVEGIIARAAAERIEVVVFVGASPVRRAASTALAQWVDRTVVVVDRPGTRTAVEDTVAALVDVDAAPTEVIWS